MKKIDVGEVIQILANIGVIASIVLLAFQLQQNNKILAATAAGVAVAQATTIWATVVEQPEIAELLVRDRQDEALTPAQEMRLNAFWIRTLSDVAYAYGTAPQGQHRWVQAFQRAFLNYGSLRRAWNGSERGLVTGRKDMFSPEFVEFMEANVFKEPTEAPAPAIKETPAPASKVPTP